MLWRTSCQGEKVNLFMLWQQNYKKLEFVFSVVLVLHTDLPWTRRNVLSGSLLFFHRTFLDLYFRISAFMNHYVTEKKCLKKYCSWLLMCELAVRAVLLSTRWKYVLTLGFRLNSCFQGELLNWKMY